MSYSPPEKRRCVFNHKKNTDDTDDALLLSQVMDNEDWIYPTQLDRASVSLLKENKRSREPVNTLSLHDDVYEITDEVNRLRNQLGDSLDENQMLTYKIRNLSRENAVLQENLIRIHQTFEKKILEQRSDFEKAERSMRNIIVHQEQDLKTKDFRDRLNQLSLAESCSSEINKSNVGESQCSPSIRLKKVTLPNFQRHQHFPRNWFSNAPALRKIFDHRKSISDTFQVIDTTVHAHFNSNKDSELQHHQSNKQIFSRQELQNTNSRLYICLDYLSPNNRLSQLYGACGELISHNFHDISQGQSWGTCIKPVRDFIVRPPYRWCR